MKRQSVLALAMLSVAEFSRIAGYGNAASFQGLRYLGGGSIAQNGYANAVSAAGSVVVGRSRSASGKFTQMAPEPWIILPLPGLE